MRSPADPPFGESRSLSVALSRTAAEGVFRLKKRSTAAAGGYAGAGCAGGSGRLLDEPFFLWEAALFDPAAATRCEELCKPAQGT